MIESEETPQTPGGPMLFSADAVESKRLLDEYKAEHQPAEEGGAVSDAKRLLEKRARSHYKKIMQQV